jgi:hypothetical protein
MGVGVTVGVVVGIAVGVAEGIVVGISVDVADGVRGGSTIEPVAVGDGVAVAGARHDNNWVFIMGGR